MCIKVPILKFPAGGFGADVTIKVTAEIIQYTVKKVTNLPVPSWHVTNRTRPGIIKLFPARENLVSDIPAGDGKIVNFFTVYNL
jgi:hypothetical protein